ncbi:MAG: hypothetical protein ACE5EH_05755 [Gammaproteobacteria bacterium]
MTDNPAKFWDRVASRYIRQPVADEEAYQKKLQLAREYLPPEMDVVELMRY